MMNTFIKMFLNKEDLNCHQQKKKSELINQNFQKKIQLKNQDQIKKNKIQTRYNRKMTNKLM